MSSTKESVEVEEPEVEEKEEATDLTNADVVTKYKTSAEICNKALSLIISLCKDGELIQTVCIAGDKFINDECNKIWKKKTYKKGSAFPVSISLNNIVGHFSPVDDDKTKMVNGDVVKVDLAVHVDGFAACAAHTFVLGADEEKGTDGKKADVILAAYQVAQVALATIKTGVTNTAVTTNINKAVSEFKTNFVQGVLSHSMEQFTIDGPNVIINKEDVEHKVSEFKFEDNQVYTIDIVVSSGDGKAKLSDERTNIFKRATEAYQLKVQASRSLLSEIDAHHKEFPFSLRAIDSKTARFGAVELVRHGLISEYPVLMEPAGEIVAQFKFTVLLMPSGTMKISGLLPVDTAKLYKSDYSIKDQAIVDLLKELSDASGSKKKKKKATAAAAPTATTTATV